MYIENTKEPQKKREKEKKNLFKQINELSNVADQYTKPLCFSTLGMNNLKMKLKNNSCYNSIKINKIFRNKFNKKMQGL